MVLKTNTWSPDTCGCRVHFQWDTDHAADEREHIPIETSPNGDATRRCQAHAHLTDCVALYGMLLYENRVKNVGADMTQAILEYEEGIIDALPESPAG